jgi:hypothetical protein
MSSHERRAYLWITVVALSGALAPAPPAPLAANVPLAGEQLKLIDQITADLDRLYKGGEISISNPARKLWALRKVDALRATGAAKDVVVAELQRYVELMKSLEAASKTGYERDTVTRADVLAAQYERLEAEIMLNQEKAR